MAGYEEMKSEAVNRIGKLDLHPDVKRRFDSTVDSVDGLYYSERTKLGGILYWLENEPEWEKKVREIEKDFDIMVYHLTHEHTEFGELLTMLYVSSDEEEWEFDNACIDHPAWNDGTKMVYAYVYNLTYPLFSEFGTVGIKEVAGGLIRTE